MQYSPPAGQVRIKLTEVAATLSLGVMMVITVVHEHVVRLRSNCLLSKAFGLQRAGNRL